MYETHLPAGSAVDSILLGMSSQSAEDVDTHFSKEMTVRLFSENPPKEPGLDLPAINTQRGRDHGLPGGLRGFCVYLLLCTVCSGTVYIKWIQINLSLTKKGYTLELTSHLPLSDSS